MIARVRKRPVSQPVVSCVLITGLTTSWLLAATGLALAEPDSMPEVAPETDIASAPPLYQPNDPEPMPDSLPDDPHAAGDSDSGRVPLRFELTAFGGLGLRLSQDAGRLATGFGFTYGMGWGDIPVMLGLNFISLNVPQHVDDTSVEQPGVEGRVNARRESRERLMHFDLWLRIQPPRWAVRPYVEGHLGMQLVQSQYGVVIGAGDTASRSEVVTDQDWVSSVGWGAGLDFWGLFNASHTVSLTLGVRQLLGETAKFRRELPIGSASSEVSHSFKTNTFILMLGVMTVFDMGVEPDPYEKRGIKSL